MTDHLVYPYPLRPDFMAQLRLPCDLTSAEVKRLTAMMETLVAPTIEDPARADSEEKP